MKGRKKIRMDLFQSITYTIVLVYILSMIFVLAFAFVNSFKDIDNFYQDVMGLPNVWHVENYANMWTDFYADALRGSLVETVYIEHMLMYSLLYAVIMAAFTIITQLCTAYAVAKYSFKLGKVIYFVAIIVMMIPIVGALPSQIKFANDLHLTDSFIGIAIMNCKYPGVYFLVFYATFKNIPWTYAEAAQIDGAGHWQIFLQIMLPMLSSTLSAIFILYFIQFWNDYYNPMIFLPAYPTIAYGLYLYPTYKDTTEPLQMAACVATCIPIITLFVIFRNKIMGNVSMGGIKG